MDLSTLTLNTDRFLRVLGDMVAVGARLQNSLSKEAPPPQEDLAGDIVVTRAEPTARSPLSGRISMSCRPTRPSGGVHRFGSTARAAACTAEASPTVWAMWRS